MYAYEERLPLVDQGQDPYFAKVSEFKHDSGRYIPYIRCLETFILAFAS